jgi:CheY-like chemotaxis protein
MKEVLLVEDNPADVYPIQKAVADCSDDIRVWFVPNGQDALTFIRKEGPYGQAPSPALILLDLNLPKLRGEDLLVEVRSLPAYQETPIVVFTSADQETAAPLVLGLGANECVHKPFDFSDYVDALKAIVSRWLT